MPIVAIFRALILLSLVVLGGGQSLAQSEADSMPPAWFIDDVNFHTQGAGRWVADN